MDKQKLGILSGLSAILIGYMGYTIYNTQQQLTQANQIVTQNKAIIENYEATYSDIYFKLNALTVAQFEEKVNKGETVYVYIGRPDCSDCNLFEPTLYQLIDQYQLAGHIFYVNVSQIHKDKEKWAAFKQKYQLQGTPVLAKYSDNKMINKIDKEELGHFTKKDMEQWLNINALIERESYEK